MAYLPEQPEWTDGVYQLEKSDPVRGGVGGPANRPLIDLLKRTAWLKQRYEEAFSGLGWAELGNGLWDWKSQPPLKSFTTRATGIVMAALCLIPLPGPLHHSMRTTTGLTLAMMYLFAQTWVQTNCQEQVSFPLNIPGL
jgi:hypothetical protein